MIAKMTTLLIKLCLIIIETSHINLSMNYYFLKYHRTLRSNNLNQKLTNLGTVEEMLKVPQMTLNKKETQMKKLLKNTRVSVAVFKDKAYWIKDNVLYKSSIDEQGEIDIDNAVPVDVINASSTELKKITEIVDQINSD